ncbi:hypothetical protein GCM10010411_94370 [Actinomadura fulvescens]|uniref:Histidine kinase/HSP90-like ATPase domain-containing protein n=2 Tax=Actinomadura fulvescens TaxID=46160 RepID=A0ABP6DE08_9ACTN
MVVAELAANSLRHTPSGRQGGEIKISVSCRTGWARVAVSDSGRGSWSRPGRPDDLQNYGRGLLIVEEYADKVGHDVHDGGQTMWAEFGWCADA